MSSWAEVWERRALEPSRGSLLAQLMAVDGLDSAFSEVTETAWSEFVRRRASEVGAGEATSVYEVGCGAGAFLYVLNQLGCRVGGLDASATLIDLARRSIPSASFDIAEASALAPGPAAEVLVSCGVFLYFPSLEYAAGVIDAMAARATRAVSILDIPDVATRAEAIAERVAVSGGEAAYRDRYHGLEHRYYDRAWIAAQMHDAGLRDVRITDQDLAGYGNARFRFNAIGWR